MNYMLLANVLEYFGREKLEKLSFVSRLFEKVVRIEFSRHPFRIFQELHIVTGTNGDIYIGMGHDENTLIIKSITPPSAYFAPLEFGQDVRHFSVRAMLPFLGKSVRFEKTVIELNSTSMSHQSITAMENFAHVWTGRTLEIQHGCDIITRSSGELYGSFAPDEAIIPSRDRIFNAPDVITPCRELEIDGIEVPLSDYPALYGVKIIKITGTIEFSGANLLNFVEGLSKYNITTILICFLRGGMEFQRTQIGEIREAFFNSKQTLVWKLMVVDNQINEKLTAFRCKNLLAKDVLEFRIADNQVKEDLCDSLGVFSTSDLWILERKPL